MVCSEYARLWLLIESVKGIGTGRWINLSRSVPVPEIARMLESAEGRERLSRFFRRAVQAPDERFVDEQLALVEKGGAGIVSTADDDYPAMLKEITVPPPILFYRGSLALFTRPCICIVGSRRSSRRGLVTARRLADDLSARGVHIVSGLARGVDTAAHEGAIEGAGGTSAVLGSGVDTIYPSENAALAERIRMNGCLLSEFPLGTPPFKHHFPQRNRILSGLSLGVVVVEGDLDSGAMGTARWAAEQNRDVFAVPGPIDHPGSRGPHRLIRDGARLVETVDDILAEYSARMAACAEPARYAGASPAETLSPQERVVLSALDLDPKHIDELVRFCDISPTAILPILLNLEMRGVIMSCGGGLYALASPRAAG
jgi:DNA processing protein